MTEHYETHPEPVPFEITLHCGCVIDGKSDGNAGWTFCPMHKAAPDLLAALEAAVSYLEDDSRSERRRQACLAGFRAEIAKARGRAK